MNEPYATFKVNVLDPSYRLVASGTFGIFDVNVEDGTGKALLNLSGSIEVNNKELMGGGDLYVKQNATGRGHNCFFFLDESQEITIMCMFGSSDKVSPTLLGFFHFGGQELLTAPPHIITT